VRPLRSLGVAVALVAAAALYAWLAADEGVPTWRRLRAEVERARGRVRGLEAGNAALSGEIRALQGDPFAQERAVREVLRWVRPGEVLVRVPDEEGSKALPPVGAPPRVP
jgi:cell division protein FtsB